MKTLTLIISAFLCLDSTGQTTPSEISNKKIRNRVLLIRNRTDSFLNKTATKAVFKRFVAEFGVTYLAGEFGRNYHFLNKEENEPDNIYDLTQYYTINDKKLGVSCTIGVHYIEISNQYTRELYSLKINFVSNIDYLKVKSLNYLYNADTQEKLNRLIKIHKLHTSFVIIEVDEIHNTYFVFLKDRAKPHNYPL